MKLSPLLFLLFIAASCHSPGEKKPAIKPAGQDPMKLDAYDSARPPYPGSEDRPQKTAPIVLKTHLRDTLVVAGNFILFLRPDDARTDEEAKNDENIMEADGDFGVGIANTMDSVKTLAQYKTIQALVSVKRYILIKDCKGGPLMIDRDTVDYGVIFSGKGKAISTIYNSGHSGDYLQQIDEYFQGSSERGTPPKE